MTARDAGAGRAPTPSLRRRLAAFVYEGVLLFGVVMFAGLVYALATQQRHALVGLHGLQLFVFTVIGLYFAWFWSHGGQTVAMKTWHVRVVRVDGRPLSLGQGLLRYALSWLWFVPALIAAAALKLHTSGAYSAALLIGVAAYAALAWLLPDRQFLHDRLCRTRSEERRVGKECRL